MLKKDHILFCIGFCAVSVKKSFKIIVLELKSNTVINIVKQNWRILEITPQYKTVRINIKKITVKWSTEPNTTCCNILLWFKTDLTIQVPLKLSLIIVRNCID